jgi:chorismate--pyruvate lyase
VIPRDDQWHGPPSVATPYRSWLIDRGSLTQRIAERCAHVRVEVVFQGLRRPDRDEHFLFVPRPRARVLVREVYLYCGATPVVFAHSVVRPEDLRGVWRSLCGLGTRPLGAALFANPRVRRGPLQQKKLGPRHELHARALSVLPDVRGPLWARRSLFVLRHSPILVTEVFLPGILAL